MHRFTNIPFFRFILVGLLNTLFSFTVYAALLLVGMDYVGANLGALLLGILFSFRTQSHFVFAMHDPLRIFRFTALWGALFLVNIFVIARLMRYGLNSYEAGALALIPITALSYISQKKWVFSAKKITQ
jgi:putative flippase GtrA